MRDALTTTDVVAAIGRMHLRIEAIRDELNAADRAFGDGDTGMTVADVVAAWTTAVQTPAESVGAMLQQLGRETRRATGSSLGSVLAIGLTAAGKAASPAAAAPDRNAMVAMLDAAVATIAERSGATAGDKTILDSLVALRNAVARDGDVVVAAEQALAEFRPREARIGRARMYGAKTVGHDDPGMLAALLLLRAAEVPAP